MICFILLCGGMFSLFNVKPGDVLTALSRRKAVTLSDELKVLTGIPVKGFFSRDYEIGRILKDTGRQGQFGFVKRLSVLLFAAGGGVAMLLGNVFLVPILCVGLSLAPVWFLRSTAGTY
jgi:hypothetical protein